MIELRSPLERGVWLGHKAADRNGALDVLTASRTASSLDDFVRQISYLQDGGLTTFIGDGKLSYKPEQVLETYYSAKAYKSLFISLNYQRIANPAYNAARGPVNILGVRAYVSI